MKPFEVNAQKCTEMEEALKNLNGKYKREAYGYRKTLSKAVESMRLPELVSQLEKAVQVKSQIEVLKTKVWMIRATIEKGVFKAINIKLTDQQESILNEALKLYKTKEL